MNHYPRHVGDITLATFGLTFAEFGCYDRLLDAYYSNESPLPLDAKDRQRMVGAVSKADRAMVDYIVQRYFVLTDDGWHNKRADEEIAAYRERSESAKRSAQASVNARLTKQPTNVKRTLNERSTNAQLEPPTNVELTSNHKPLAKSQEPEPKATVASQPTPTSKTVTTAPSEPRAPTVDKNPTATATAFEAYSVAYLAVYNAEPVRNATVMGQMAQFVKRIGAHDAPHVAAWYVRSKNQFYVSRGHPVGQLLTDAEKIRTEWATGRSGTITEARQGDRTQATANTFTKLIEEARNGD